ncbi:MAG: cation diffusion facilitator family transporter [Myxococcales bacterium]|nr:cation diffusion facilitator family transporter [Myxococcales bacterium]
MPDPEVCKRCSRAVPWLSLWGNLGMALYKLVVGMIGGSAALVADSMHSFADVVGSTGILVATRVSSRNPNNEFPYGMGKAEFIGAAFVYTVLLFFAGGIVYHSIVAMLGPGLEAPGFVTLLGAVVSVFYNYLMYKYATCVGMRNHSPAILADAFENRADAISSAACIFGILGAIYINPICDPIAALIVGIIIFWNCQEQLREAATGLMDGGLPADEAVLLERLALRSDGVVDVDAVRTRRTGAGYWVDLSIRVDPELPVAQSDPIAAAVRDEIKKYPQFHHVEVFVLPRVGDGTMPAEGAAPAAAPA